MKADKILKEILENNPELENKEKELIKIIKSLVESNPNIKADVLFKQKLKDKLDTIIGIKSNKKTNKINFSFLTGLMNVFGALFVAFGIYYFTSGITFFHDNESIILPVINIESEENIGLDLIDNDIEILNDELSEIDKIILEELSGVSNENDEKINSEVKKQNVNSINNLKNIPTQDKVENMKIDSSPIKEFDNNQETDIKTQKDIEVNFSNTNDLIDTQIIDLLGEPELNDSSINDLNNSIDSFGIDGVFDIGVENKMFQENGYINDNTSIINELEKLVSFEEICAENRGEIIVIELENVCKIDEKKCKESEYKNGTCDFLEKK